MGLLRSLLGRLRPGPPRATQRAVLEECEPRILYSADLNPALWASDHGAAVVRLADADDTALDTASDPASAATASAPVDAAVATAVEPRAQAERATRELVVIDPNVPDYQAFVDDMVAQRDGPRHFEVVVLDATRDGVAQLTELFAQRNGLDALHIVSHGEPGSFQLAGSRIDGATVVQHEEALRGWARAFGTEGDIHIYGCEVAATPDGRMLLETIAGLTATDVAANADATGHALLGGDWKLESGFGSVQAKVAFDADLQGAWANVLLGTVGGEFRANTTTSGTQAAGVAAMDANGNFVVVWTSDQGGTVDIYAQRYDASGAAQGSEFRVNTTTTDSQDSPAVAMDADGDFVVVWSDSVKDGSGYGIYAQRYNAAGAAQGAEFRINTVTTSAQDSPAVAMDASGNFVVTWRSLLQDLSGYGVYAQRYAADGSAQGAEFRVTTTTTGDQGNPAIACSSAGAFVIVWEGWGSDDDYGIFGQRYNAAGAAQGSEFRINGTIDELQTDPRVAMDPSGNFVVTWTGGADDDHDIYMRRYNAAGVAQEGETRVHSGTSNDQYYSDVINSAGGMAVAFTSWGQPSDGDHGIFARTFSPAGVPDGAEFNVNTTRSGDQEYPSIATNGSTHAVIVWTNRSGGGSDANGVFGQLYGPPENTAPVNTIPANQYTPLDTNRVFSAGNGNQISIADADAGTNPVQVTLALTNGTVGKLSLSGTSGLTFHTGDGTADATMTFAGTVTDINSALNGMAFAPTSGYRGLAGLVLITDDRGNTGTGGARSDTDTVHIHVGALVVTTTNDTSNGTVSSIESLVANDGGDGISLREAIEATNNSVGLDYIQFDIVGAGPHTINVASALPTITQAVILDASSEPGFAANGNRPVVVLDGDDLAADGLVLGSAADGSTIRGLVIRDFGHSGIYVQPGAEGNTIAGNYVGRLNTSGTDAGAGEGNTRSGIWVEGSNNTIGGVGALDRNLLSGNGHSGVGLAAGSGNVVQGNYIGVDASGANALGNTANGVYIDGATRNTIGGSTAAARNVISGNLAYGIMLTASTIENNIQGNVVGLTAGGDAALANAQGIWVEGAQNLIGGITADQRNVISGNSARGIVLSGTRATDNVVQGNYIGTDVTGLLDIDGTTMTGSRSGVVMWGGRTAI